MPRLKLTLAYVGTHYHGWQTQARPTGPQLLTIQSLVEAAVAHILGAPVHVHGAGRTDSGVHADAQVAHLDIPESRVSLDWQLALNTSLPRDIRIVEAKIVPQRFHAQHSAIRKTYEYRLWLSRRYTPPKLYPFVWACGALDVARMDETARYLLGRQDFASLKNAGTDLVSTVRTMLAIERTPTGSLPENQLELTWIFEADGFLKQMVRNCVGLLVAAGLGKLAPEEVPEILQSCDRRLAPLTAPARGLTLKKVWYPEEDALQETAEDSRVPVAEQTV
ncbi:MAG: tRNA pseudouridine(38-40) synthase TruA [Bilophila sp.]